MEKGGYALVADIGGTNARFAIAQRTNDDHIALRWQVRHDTAGITDFIALVNNVLEEMRRDGFAPSEGCIATTGHVGVDVIKPSNASYTIERARLASQTALHRIKVINDFEAIAESVNVLTSEDVFILNGGKQQDGTGAVLGAGTGLGKAILYWNGTKHVPIASEGGHSDFPPLTSFDQQLVEFIKRRQDINVVSYEELLSGRGLEALYAFIHETRWPRTPSELGAAEISVTRESNPAAGEAFSLFVRYYARCARNFALDTLAIGGLYLAGGIAAKNARAFAPFMESFVSHQLYNTLLRDIPVAIITNEDVGMLGAAASLMRTP